MVEELLHKIETETDQKTKVDLLNKYAFDLRNVDHKKALEYASQALSISEEINYLKGKAGSLNVMGFAYIHSADNEKAFSTLLESISVFESLNDKVGVADAKYTMGVLQLRLGIFDQAISFVHSSLAIREELNDKAGIAACYFQLTYIDQHFNDLDSAFINATKGVEIRKQLKDINGLAASLMVLGEVYLVRKDYVMAKKILAESLELRKESGEKMGYFSSLYRWTDLHIQLEEFDTARESSQLGLSMSTDENVPMGIMRFLHIGGKLEMAQKNLAAAKEKYLIALDYAKKYKFKSVQYEILESLTKIYKEEGDYKSAYEHYVQFHKLKEEVISLQTNTQLKSVQFMNQIEFSRKEADLEKEKNIELQKAYSIIEDKNHEIIDSINYARRIQYTLLANNTILNQNLNEHFVFFKPKDIVSGDFYWATKKGNNFYLAVCDSTGHGVPGAFMSLLNISFLNEAINERNICKPNEILDYVRQKLIENISQEGQSDGMDAILICINKENGDISYSAANNRPVLVSDNVFTELPKDPMPIGKGERTNGFNLFTINKEHDTTLYLYTDGFADQFGGPKGKKFKYRQLNELLASGFTQSLTEQKNILEQTFDNWKGDLEQVDDVCIIGIKI